MRCRCGVLRRSVLRCPMTNVFTKTTAAQPTVEMLVRGLHNATSSSGSREETSRHLPLQLVVSHRFGWSDWHLAVRSKETRKSRSDLTACWWDVAIPPPNSKCAALLRPLQEVQSSATNTRTGKEVPSIRST
jgi:hypothetical protein